MLLERPKTLEPKWTEQLRSSALCPIDILPCKLSTKIFFFRNLYFQGPKSRICTLSPATKFIETDRKWYSPKLHNVHKCNINQKSRIQLACRSLATPAVYMTLVTQAIYLPYPLFDFAIGNIPGAQKPNDLVCVSKTCGAAVTRSQAWKVRAIQSMATNDVTAQNSRRRRIVYTTAEKQ